MKELLLFAALLVALHVGFALLALSQARHWRAIGVGPPLPRMAAIIVRAFGFALLSLALPIALWRDGADFGSLLWGVLLSVAACAVTLTLTWHPGWLKPLALAVHAIARVGLEDAGQAAGPAPSAGRSPQSGGPAQP
jgi:hypothetical protein